MSRHSLFFAIMADRETADRAFDFAGKLRQGARLSGRPRPRETLHVSLLSMAWRAAGAPPGDAVALARDRASTVTARPFKVSLNRVEGWKRDRPSGPVVLVGEEGVIGVDNLHRQIALAQGRRPDPGFCPHMSILWSSSDLEPRYVEPFTWTVREFGLVHSLVGLSRYEILGRFPLVGAI